MEIVSQRPAAKGGREVRVVTPGVRTPPMRGVCARRTARSASPPARHEGHARPSFPPEPAPGAEPRRFADMPDSPIPYCGPPPTPADLLAAWNGDPALLAALALAAFAGEWHLRRTRAEARLHRLHWLAMATLVDRKSVV